MSQHSEVTIEEGSTNVYADLGYADAAEMQRKSQLAGEIARAIKARRLTQDGAAALLGIDQPKISRITRGQFRGVSEAKLLGWWPSWATWHRRGTVRHAGKSLQFAISPLVVDADAC